MGFISPSGPMFKMVASFTTSGGAALLSLVINSLSVIIACCALATGVAAMMDAPTRKIASLLGMRASQGPALRKRIAPLGAADEPTLQRRKSSRENLFRGGESGFEPVWCGHQT